MKRPYTALFFVIIAGLILRLLLLSLIHNPGINDQNHYYNLGRRLVEGQGFTIDYVWHYSHVPDDIVHPIDHWMPLAGVAVAAGMTLGGQTPHAALIVFILVGTFIPLLVYGATKQLKGTDSAALIAAIFAAVLPDLVWNSLRTDTTILNMMFITGSVLLLNYGLRQNKWRALVLSGIGVGLAYLTRNDSIVFLPMLIVVLVLYLWKGRAYVCQRRMVYALMLTPLAFAVTVSPWLIRNQQVLGMWGPAETGRMFFMVDQREHYAYDTVLTFESMLERQTPGELVSKRLFELMAAVKQMALSLEIVLMVSVPFALMWLMWQRDWNRLLLIAPALVWLAGILVAYPILLPLKSQSGSFEKAFLTIVPLLIPPGAIALDRFIQHPVAKWLLVSVAVAWMTFNSYRLVARETMFADTYYASIVILTEQLATMPDLTGDGEIRLMTQDPYVMSTFGYKSIMTPLATREQTLELAQRYAIDYLLMPAGRPALDDLYLGQDVDERFILAANIDEAGEKPFELYRFVWD